MRRFTKAVTLLLSCFVTLVSLAQEACPDIVLDALGSMENACELLGRNEACYGNGSILALDADGEELSDFAESGDIAEVTTIGSLSLSGLNEDEGLWGIAVLSVQADIPSTLPGQNVTMLLFGESELATVEDDASAFIFSAGIGQLACEEAPNGLIIQTPEGAGTINLDVNNIVIELGSTAYLTAEADGEFVFALLEGHAVMNTGESEVEVNGGEFSTISLDEDLNPVGEFSEVLPIEGNLKLPVLPLSLLPRDISEGGSTSSGEIIVPRAGTWDFVFEALDAPATCPAMLTAAMQGGMDENFSYDFGGEGWDFESFYREMNLARAGMEAPNGTYSSPEPNVYVLEAVDNGTPITFTLTVLSETELHGSQSVDLTEFAAGCTITIEISITFSE